MLGFCCCNAGFSLVAAGQAGATLVSVHGASPCDGFYCGAQALGHLGFSICGLRATEHGLNSGAALA